MVSTQRPAKTPTAIVRLRTVLGALPEFSSRLYTGSETAETVIKPEEVGHADDPSGIVVNDTDSIAEYQRSGSSREDRGWGRFHGSFAL